MFFPFLAAPMSAHLAVCSLASLLLSGIAPAQAQEKPYPTNKHNIPTWFDLDSFVAHKDFNQFVKAPSGKRAGSIYSSVAIPAIPARFR